MGPAISPDDSVIITASWDRRLKVWDAGDRELPVHFEAEEG
jgi:WD40 repeat protein